MKKSQVLKFFGDGDSAEGARNVAHALGIGSQAVWAWPEDIGKQLAPRIIVAAQKLWGVNATRKEWPEYYQSKAS